MPTYDTPNSHITWDVPEAVGAVNITVRGGTGGDGAPGYDSDGGDPGAGGGEVTGRVSLKGVSSLALYIGEDGEDATAEVGGVGGESPLGDAGDGGDGATSTQGYYGGGGGGGGSKSRVELPDGMMVADAGGGGGGMGENTSNAGYSTGGGGGGGGSLGGSGGSRGNSTDDPDVTPAEDGEDAEGSGLGGDGGGFTISDNPATAGGAQAGTPLTSDSTGTSTSGAVVVLEPLYPPAAPTDFQATDVRATEVDVEWTDLDSEPNTSPEDGYRVYTSRDGGQSWTEVADLAADTESHTLTGLLTGEQYQIQVEAYNDFGYAATETVLVGPEASVTEASPTETRWRTVIEGEYITEG